MAKKTFLDDIDENFNPASQFISTPKEKEPEAEEKPAPIPPKKESKSKRLQLLMKPSVYEKIKEKAYREGMSVNACINELLEKGVE